MEAGRTVIRHRACAAAECTGDLRVEIHEAARTSGGTSAAGRMQRRAGLQGGETVLAASRVSERIDVLPIKPTAVDPISSSFLAYAVSGVLDSDARRRGSASGDLTFTTVEIDSPKAFRALSLASFSSQCRQPVGLRWLAWPRARPTQP